MKSILNATSSRFRLNHLGYSFIVFIAGNWKGFFLLAAASGTAQERLIAFGTETSAITLYALPFTAGLLAPLITPWINGLISLTSHFPLAFIDKNKIDLEHRSTAIKARLETAESELLTVREDDLIQRAKRDKQVSEIQNEQIKEELQQQIYMLRQQQASLSQDYNKILNKNSSQSELFEDSIISNKSKYGLLSRDEMLSRRNEELKKREDQLKKREEELSKRNALIYKKDLNVS